MNQQTEIKPPIWFWVVSVLALIWNLMGVYAYIDQVMMSPEAIAKLPQDQQAALAALPGWYTAVFATAVFAAALGCLCLLLRKKWATALLSLSFAAVVLQQIYFWVLTDLGSKQHGAQLAMAILIPIVALLLVLLAKSATTKGWLR